MRTDPLYRKITAEEFLNIDFGTDRRFELVDGVIQMMTGGTSVHARVAGNIFFFLRKALQGSGCMPYNSDMGVQVDETNVRYPDVTIYCGDPGDFTKDTALTFPDPHVIFEVLSQSTSALDQGTKFEEYRALPSVQTVVFVHAGNELTRVMQREGPYSWRDSTFAEPHDVELPSLGLTLPHAEMFLRA